MQRQLGITWLPCSLPHKAGESATSPFPATFQLDPSTMGGSLSKYDPTRGIWRLPDKKERDRIRAGAPINPVKVFAIPRGMEQIRFWTGWYCWMMDSYTYFAVSLGVSQLQRTLQRRPRDITNGIMVALLTRAGGAILVGAPADRYGRRWVLSGSMLCLAALTLATPYADSNFHCFLAVRALYGIFMGGVWGLSNATALEDLPVSARGLYSGMFQQGYAAGNMLCAIIHLGWVPKVHRWTNERGESRGYAIMFYFGAGMALLAAIFRALLPEGPKFKAQRELLKSKGEESVLKGFMTIFTDLLGMLRHHWFRVVYTVLLMAGFNFFSHASQDLFPKMLQNDKNLSQGNTDRIVILSMLGAICGGMISGWLSQYLGRRLCMAIFVIIGGAMVPAWILPNSFSGLAAGAFWLQFGVQGAFGPVPVYLNELSPPAFRATFPGLAFQVGSMPSSASATIETKGGDHIQKDSPAWRPGDDPATRRIPDYGKVSGILLGCVAGYLLVMICLGVENPGAEFEIAEDDDKKMGAHRHDIEAGDETNKIGASAEHPNTVPPEKQPVNMEEGNVPSSNISDEAAQTHA